MGPLDGTQVIELSQNQAGCLAGMLLGDYGATVIRIDQPMGDDLRFKPGYIVWNRNKKSVTLNLEHPRGREILLQLLEESDVLLETLEPPEMARLGLGYETLHPRFPRLVYCSLTGYDINGPDWGRPGYDGLVQARAGIMTGGNWNPVAPGSTQAGHRPGPKYMGFAAPSYSAAFFTCLGISTALYVQRETGQGQHVNNSLHGAVMAMSRWGWAENPGPPPPPSRALGGLWKCQDGEWIWTHTGLRGSFDRFMEVLGLKKYMASAPDPLPWSDELTREVRPRVAEVFMTRPRVEWIRLFDEADCPNQPTMHPGDSFDDEQVRHIEMVVAVDDPELGPVQEVGMPIKFEKTPGAVKSSAPRLGEHTMEVLMELGVAQDEIAVLKRDGAI